jgi:threonylcarbamoyladenosine tRNA methylthiotransferase CDKAL1
MKPIHKACVLANGCPENRIDAGAIQEFFKHNGWPITTHYREADLILFNACAATLYSQESSIEIIQTLRARKHAGAQLIVCGCLPKINEKRLREVFDGPTIGPHEMERLREVVETNTAHVHLRANYLLPILFRWKFPSRCNVTSLMSAPKFLTRVYQLWHEQGVNNIGAHDFCIKISTGCLNACSYCAIRLSRGRVSSKPIKEIVQEFEEGCARGYKDFALIATDLGAYGRDQGTDLSDLLGELVRTRGDYRIKLQYIQPRFLIEMMPRLRGIFDSGRIAYLCAAAESGSDRILKLMKRGYRVEDFAKTMASLKRQYPQIKLSTQVMVGFPGETDEEFLDTLRLIDEVGVDSVEAYVYQPRSGTMAAEMEEQVPARVGRKRLLKLYIRSLFKEYRVFVW